MGTRAGAPSVSSELEKAFPGLQTTEYQVTSPADPHYNCVAWAAGVDSAWWWPAPAHPRYAWPHGAGREETLSAFAQAFALFGYTECASDTLELDFEKVAVFVNSAGTPTHVSRQLPSGRWTSKLGRWVDIEHLLDALEGNEYGTVVLVMRRPRTRPSR